MSGTTFGRLRKTVGCLAAFAGSLLAADAARAGDLFSGRLYTVPEKVYVNQAFVIHFELEVTAGCEVEDLRISNFPNDPNLLTLGRLETASRTATTRDGQPATVLHFEAQARGLRPLEQTFAPRLQCSLVQRRSVGFFSQWQSQPRQLQLAPFALRIKDLPAEGRPEPFSGAVGVFKLTGKLSQTTARPGDIITLSLDLVGEGWLNQAQLPAPPPHPLFKTYPPKERLREPLHLQSEQVFIPQATNATELAAVRFRFFNPGTERYEESVAGPFTLTFSEAAAPARAETVRVIDTSRPTAGAEGFAPSVTIERVNATFRKVLPLLAGGAGAGAALFVVFLLYGRHKRLALLSGAALLALGAVLGAWLNGRTGLATRATTRHSEVRFAPSQAAATLFTLNPGAAVTPLERAGSWVRVDAAGRRGWMPADALSAK